VKPIRREVAMRRRSWAAVVLGVLLAWPASLQAGRPVIVEVAHEATFRDLADYPDHRFFLAAGQTWQPLEPGVPVRLNRPEWREQRLHLYAIPMRSVADGLPPVGWIADPLPEVKRSVKALAVRYESVADYDIIGRGAFPMSRAGLGPPGDADPPRSHGPIVPYRFLTVYRVTLADELRMSVADEQAFDKRANLLVETWEGRYVLASRWYAAKWALVGLLVAATAALWLFLLRRRRAHGNAGAG
jgi:hypothetical protein